MYCTIIANSMEIKFELHHVYVFSKVLVSVIKISPVGFSLEAIFSFNAHGVNLYQKRL